MKDPFAFLSFAAAAALFAFPVAGQQAGEAAAAPPATEAPAAPSIASILDHLGEDGKLFDQHVTTLANPFMEGRVPGSRGMEIAREYFEFYLKKAGTLPAFPVEGDAQARSYRQPFSLAGGRKPASQHLAVKDRTFRPGEDFAVLGLGGSGEVTAPVVFVGYAINSGRDGYTSFPQDEQLDGKIAMVLRFEPMTAEGKSKWSERGPWTRNESLAAKVRAVARRGAAGVLIVNPPGADDPRANELMAAGSGGRGGGGGRDVPVAHVANGAAQQILEAIAPGTSLLELRKACDEAGKVVAFDGEVSIKAEMKMQRITAENVGGMIPGRGALAEEWIVIGGHLDHLGTGLYGARDARRIGELHPGADDNASGSAAVLMLADKLERAYDRLPEGTPARSILLVGFDAEEAGLHGARHYTQEPIAPIEKHALMINFDMIGRITDKKLSVSGTGTAKGMQEWLAPLFARSPLDVVDEAGMLPLGSDHMMFGAKRVPWLFAIIGNFHNDYHTPDDAAWKINREDAVHTIALFHEIALTAATRTEPFEYEAQPRAGRRGR
jgi:hypothetical protein